MFLNGKDPSEWQRIVKIDDYMVNEIKSYVKDAYLKGYGQYDVKYTDIYNEKVKKYLKTVPPKDRLAACYTIDQIYFNECDKYINKIREHFPNWQGGQKFDTSIFDNYLDVSI